MNNVYNIQKYIIPLLSTTVTLSFYSYIRSKMFQMQLICYLVNLYLMSIWKHTIKGIAKMIIYIF